MNVPDNYDLWEAHDREQTAALELLPICDMCNDPIQDEYLYDFNGELICEYCLDKFFKKRTEDFVV